MGRSRPATARRTFLEPFSWQAFREQLGVGDAVWNRGRGRVLWKGMIVLAQLIQTNAIEAVSAKYAVDQLLDDYRKRGR